MSKNKVATPAAAGLVKPAFLEKDGALGNENVTRNDVVIPRIALIQALSPQLKKADANYIQGAEIGDIFNTLTNDLYKDKLYVVNCFFVAEVAVFRKRNAGGGFRGIFRSVGEAMSHINASPDKDVLEAVEQGVHYCLLLNDDKQHIGEAAIVFQSTKLKVSRRWNGLIRNNPDEPRFGRVWKLGSTNEKNEKGEFANFTVCPAGFVTEELYTIAKAFYQAVNNGERVVDRTEGGGDDVVDPSDY